MFAQHAKLSLKRGERAMSSYMYYVMSKENNNSNTIKVTSIYTEGKTWGYKYNVNHPFVNDLYRRYKKWKGIPEASPMSNEQRQEFEAYIDEYFAKQEKIKEKREG